MPGRAATTTNGPPSGERAIGPFAAARAALGIVDPGVRRRFFVGLVPSVALGVLEAAGVALVLPLVVALGGGDQAGGGALGGRLVRLVARGHASPPMWIAVAALGALIVRTAASAALVAWQLRVVAASERELTRRLLRVYLTQPWSFHQDRDLAELTGNVRLNVWQIHAQMVTPAFTLPGELAVVASVAVVLVAVDPLAAAAVALIFGAVVLSAVRLGGRRAAQAGADVQASATELQQRVHDGLRAAKSLSVHGGGDVLAGRMEEALAAGERARYHMAIAQYLPRYLLEATMAAGVGGLALALRASSSVDPVATLALFATGGVRIMGPLSRMVSAGSSLRTGARLLEPVARDLALAVPPVSAAAAPGGLGRPPEVALDHVSFVYPGSGRAAVAGVELRIEPGSFVAVTGPSASGKTTLLDLVLGLRRPTAGTVLVDGAPLDEAATPSWLARAAYVPQDALVLDDTVRRNVAFGVADDEIDDEAVRRALADVDLELGEGDGLDTVLGDRDGRLSGGERQRLAIARALYRDPDILVLDEPTSSLDQASEARLVATIRRLAGRRTVIMVTHRPAAAACCDRIVALDRGRLVDDDSGDRRGLGVRR